MRAFSVAGTRAIRTGFGVVGLAGLVGLVGLVGCSSGNTPAPANETGEGGAACDPCEDGGSQTQVGAGHDSNPQGVPYPAPAGGYGHTARVGTTPGSIIQNFKFLGYVNGDDTKPLTTVSLADYYDPCAKTIKLIHLSVAAVWCVPCNEETSDFVTAQSSLTSQGIVVLQALDDGPVEGTPATVSDLNYWIGEHKPTFTEMLDPGLQNYAGFFNAAAIPWNADVDPRTMELLDSSEGYSGMVQEEVETGLQDIGQKPLYPIPASANCN